MRAERDPMRWKDGASALGAEERSNEAPRAGAGPASGAPDPEVVAKYGCGADRCTRQVGRPPKSAWRKARRNGSLQGLRRSRRQSGRVHPLSARYVSSKRRWRGWRSSPPHTRFSKGKSCDSPQRREGLLMASASLASHVGIAPACERWACHGPPSIVVRGPLPGARPRSTPALRGRTRAGPGHARVARFVGEVACSTRQVSHPGCELYTKQLGHRAEPNLVVGYHPPAGTLLPLRDIFSRYGGVDGRRTGKRRSGCKAHRTILKQAIPQGSPCTPTAARP